MVHFKDGYTPRVAPHGAVECSLSCKKVLFLKPDGREVPSMNKAGYVDIRKVYELPLKGLSEQRDHGKAWRLRDCSFSLITDLARDAIASLFTSWQPRCATEMLCKKLDLKYLEEDGLICWVEATSKKLVDCNGTSYTGSGPCVVIRKSSATATICVVSASTLSISVRTDNCRCLTIVTIGVTTKDSKASRMTSTRSQYP